MKIIIKIILIILFNSLILSAQSKSGDVLIKPESLGLTISKGNIDKSKMTSKQKDTIVYQLFDYSDVYYDIAVAYRSLNKIIIYKNLGNGYLNEFKVISPVKKIKSILADYQYDIKTPNKKAELQINFSDGTKQIISSEEINSIKDNQDEVMVPRRNILDDPKVFVYNLDFIQVWQSERSPLPSRWVSYGDFDKDGKEEMVWTLFPSSENSIVTRMVVFECYGNDLFRVDWDTTLSGGGYNVLPYMTDFDRDGNKEFFGVGWINQIGTFDNGIFECTGQGKYIFRGLYGCLCGQLEDVSIMDSTFYNVNTGNSGMWTLNSYSGGNTTIRLQVFNQKFAGFYQFDEVFNANRIRFSGFTYDFTPGDIDGDGRTELILGNTQFGTNYVEYLDSTGLGSPLIQGYEFKEIIPNAPVSAGWMYVKDYDGDGVMEVTTCGIGRGSGSIGVIKHTGSPGSNNFTTMWWDSTNIFASPNYGIDTGRIDNSFNLLYPYVFSSGPHFWNYLLTYNRTNTFTFERSSYKYTDSSATLSGLLRDVDHDGKANIITPIGYDSNLETFVYLNVYEQTGTIGINNSSSTIPYEYSLYQNYPNPFNPQTVISYDLKKTAYVKLTVHDIRGKEIGILINENKNSGQYEVVFDGRNLNSGIYFYSLFIDSKFINAKKMLLIK